ncbi:MAG: hypothetical protein HYU60_00350 [Magnetospirillum sp.]|nr:hypothetical protein [Magnetospirillum sp.]
MSKKSPYGMVVGGSLTLDLLPSAQKVVEDHAQLLADGYVLKTPVTVRILKDGTTKVPFTYKRKFADRSGWETASWTVTVYAGWFFGKGPQQ